MGFAPPLRPWTELPEGLKDLPRIGFVRRPPATSEEAERTDIVFRVKNMNDLLRRAEFKKAKAKPPQQHPVQQANQATQEPARSNGSSFWRFFGLTS